MEWAADTTLQLSPTTAIRKSNFWEKESGPLARRLGRKTWEVTGNLNQMTALRFQNSFLPHMPASFVIPTAGHN